MKTIYNFTRGGQLAVHQFRMTKQVLSVSICFSILVGFLVFGVLMYCKVTSYQWYLYRENLSAEFMVNLSSQPEKVTQDFRGPDGDTRKVSSQWILGNSIIQSDIHYVNQLAEESSWKGFWATLASILLAISVFVVRGRRQSLKILERGSEVVSSEILTKLIQKKNLASDLNLDGLPLIKGKETSHILIIGTVGSGKSNCFNTLLPQIRKRPNPALIVDLTGDFVARYFQKEKDLLLNPFDERSQNWSPWADCLTSTHYDALAAAIVPKSTHMDKFWENAGKALLSTALQKLAQINRKDIEYLYDLLVCADMRFFSQFFQNTEAASYTHMDGEKMTLSITATLANHIQSFKYLKPTNEGFSIRKWVSEENKGQWLFISARPDQRETLRPLISGWIDTAINALMTLSPDIGRRLWFVLDELPALQKLPSLEPGMAEARKYGGCFMAGVQSFPQLIHLYGPNQAQSVLDLFNTKIFFRNTDPNTTGWISKVLGESEVKEHIENLSYGANTIRDGVSLSPQTKTKSLVLPTEITALEDLESYIKVPNALPVGRIKMNYKKIEVIAESFVPCCERKLEAEEPLEKKVQESESSTNIADPEKEKRQTLINIMS